MAKKYCGCYGLDTGVTLIGFLHLNAALYFWARVSTFEPIYMWVDVLIAACYTIRATYFFMMLNKDCDKPSRKDYFDMNNLSAYGLLASGVAIICLRWLEWAHPPTWQFVAWGLVAAFNWYHYTILDEYKGMPPPSKVQLAEKSPAEDALFADKVAEKDDSTQLLVVNKME
mmetsp:Transcript_44718/g.59364  ORF Transcript_44718/g.59364 Transcript_44718/m.59364 type:complete len:171 (-) Transcript_44718:114-626(-)|eukprot:CAMPEP_0185578318 /NCGR_PEP_ID=MMETSP0434-20130131/12595_1 /TAXON_ID=626734 ORGANISM="Favella taraikaensis, Strain Fe Narragansett Bay" /NCGR_SAMPLE_ID=MMETSP0434 /ASSEMBLY_ACC=CAM_ASM_000379 /LENGTH=170 /DNA_ID=CAMNT_0028196091 /DNA_START=28 /DNA_END=540 /DNA_ORIENTATION=+